MCEFVSWVERKEKNHQTIYFLTGEQIFHSPRGEALRKWSGNSDDFTGHGAIRFYYDFDDGENKECSDFVTPANFPDVIATAIKRGDMRGMAQPEGLLSGTALAEYEKICGTALVEYQKIRGTALAEYEKIRGTALAEYEKIRGPALAEYQKICGTALAEYEKICDTAWAEYQKICGTALVEYEKICDTALAEYQKICDTAFWDLFAIPENRVLAWR